MTDKWTPGEVVVERGIDNMRVRVARSVILVKHSNDETALLLMPGAECALTEGYFHWKHGDYSLGTRWQEAKRGDWKLRRFRWETNRFLILLEPRKHYSCYLVWESATDQFKCYYINFQLPYCLSHCGFDTFDLDLDLVINPEFRWKWKDEADYQEGIREGGIHSDWVEAVEDAQHEVFHRLDKRLYPFDGSWLDWRPAPSWTPPSLPERWDVV